MHKAFQGANHDLRDDGGKGSIEIVGRTFCEKLPGRHWSCGPCRLWCRLASVLLDFTATTCRALRT